MKMGPLGVIRNRSGGFCYEGSPFLNLQYVTITVREVPQRFRRKQMKKEQR